MQGNINILKVFETKPTRQFVIKRFTARYRSVKNGPRGGILVYVRENIPSKLLTIDFSSREVSCRDKSQKKEMSILFVL